MIRWQNLKYFQRFVGLNAWDQLSIEIEISGTLPEIPQQVAIQFNDITEEYSYNTDTSVRSVGNRRVLVADQELVLNIDQEVFRQNSIKSYPIN